MKEWEAVYDEYSGWWIICDENGEIGSCDGGFEEDEAKLMASAPALLRELQNMISVFQYTDESEGQNEAVQSAKQTLEKYGL